MERVAEGVWVVRAGAGVPVVLSHGLGDNSRTWQALEASLRVDHTVVTWDLPGHGSSAEPLTVKGYSLDAAVDHLASIISVLGEPAHLVGHSLGGFVSLALALSRPELVLTLTLIASGPGYRDNEARAAWNTFVDEAATRMPIPDAAARLGHQHDSWVIDRTPELVPPLLVVVGGDDTRFHGSAAFFARAVPGARSVRIEGAGHHPQRSHPADVAGAIAQHVAQSDHARSTR